jgi:signal transduction histidine kinase
VQSRSRTFLTFALFCVLPLLLISGLSFFLHLRSGKSLLSEQLEDELAHTTYDFDDLLRHRQTELNDVASSSAMRKYVTAWQAQASIAAASGNDQISEVRDSLGQFLRDTRFYSAVAVVSPARRLLCVAEFPQLESKDEMVFHTKDLLPDQIQADEAVWTTSEQQSHCTLVAQPVLGKTLRCTTPILVWEEQPKARGALVADLKTDALISSIAPRSGLPFFKRNGASPQSAIMVIALDDSGEIVYHTNAALKHQSESSMPYFREVATAMIAGQSGTKLYRSANGDEWLAAYAPLHSTRLSLVIARNYSLAAHYTRRNGWLGIALALLIGSTTAVFLTNYSQRRTKSINQVAAGVGEIVKGKLDHRIELLSSDDLRPLADNVGLVTKQLREQIAREAEGHQFQSFVRLSAVLTHDLKNAIEALSLIVNNMEQHFEKEEFRADAMRSLTVATDKLRALVARLSNPVNTLSGEHKRPRPVDLVPILKRVIAMNAEPARGQHEILIKLPESLFALVDAERIDKVVENLIINALEAMGDKRGTLTIAAGETGSGKPFFSVSDTGEGMSERFIAERLFHPFATTKRKGVGLGLYTCREVVNANGGTIEVASRQGAGATFRVVLPSAHSQRGE